MASEYELKRLENIKRNERILSELNIQDAINKATPTPIKRKRDKSADPYRKGSARDTERRSSLRLKKEKPEFLAYDDPEDLSTKAIEAAQDTPKEQVIESDIDTNAIKRSILDFESNLNNSRTQEYSTISKWAKRLSIHNIEKLVPSRIYSLAFHPAEKPIIFCGDKEGHFSVWDVDQTMKFKNASPDNKVTLKGKIDPASGISLYKSHKGSISCILNYPTDTTKVMTSSYDGLIRQLDIESSKINTVIDNGKDRLVTRIDINKQEPHMWYFSCMNGEIGIFDERAKSSSNCKYYQLHEKKIGCISLHPTEINSFVTASLDTTAAVWDKRMLKAHGTVPLSVITNKKSLTSAYYEPVSGEKLLTTCYDDAIRIYDSQKLENDKVIKILHNNQTGRWITQFRAMWAPWKWDNVEPWFVVGNMKRSLDIFSGVDGSRILSLTSDVLTAQPAVNAIHSSTSCPWIASGTASGKVALWRAN